jgi:hypothetical protein
LERKLTSTLETPSARAKKKLARGVYFDRRIRKFTAQINIAGKRMYLGSFDTEEDAAAAHALARHDNPIRRGLSDGGETFAMAFDAFLQDQAAHTGLSKGTLAPGVEFEAPTGQRYFMARVDTVRHPSIENVKWVYYRWCSECSECGVDFVTSTRAGKKQVTGMTRTCAKHRKGGARPDEPAVHGLLAKDIRAAQAKLQTARKQEEEDEAEVGAAVYAAAQIPGATREDLRRVRDETRAAIAARRSGKDDESLV